MLAGLIGFAAVAATVFTISSSGTTPGLVVGSWSVVALGVALSLSRRPAVVPVTTYSLVITGLFAGSESETLAIAAMIVQSLVVVLFTARNVAIAVAAVSVLTFLAPIWWHGLDGVPLAVAAGVATFAATMLVTIVTSESIEMAQTTEALFEHAPIAIFEQDWSAPLTALDELTRTGITDMEAYLREHPAEVVRILSSVQMLTANQEAVKAMALEGTGVEQSPIDPVVFERNIALLVDMANHTFVRRAVVYPLIDANGTVRWHLFNSFPHPAGNGRFIVSGADITELEEAKQALEVLHVSKDRFIAAISHELRTPLAAVVGFSSELLERPELMKPDERDEALRFVSEHAMAAADIIADLLVVARADIGGVTVGHDAVDIATEIARALAGQHEQVTVSGADLLPAVCADVGRIHQILRNLLTNAVRYGGPERRVMCSADDDHVSIEVRDDGQELAQIELDTLFQPYTRAHQAAGITESVGLGLTVSRHLAQAMNGTLTAYRDGYENVFRLDLPVWGRCPTTDNARASSIA